MNGHAEENNRRQLTRLSVGLRVRIEHVDSGDHLEALTADFHHRGLFARVPEKTQKGDILFVTFLDAPSQAASTGRCQHLNDQGAGISLNNVPNAVLDFLLTVRSTTLELEGYQLEQYLKSGGMAHVYRGSCPEEKPVAIKRLLPHYAQDENAVELFLAEAELLRRSAHPGLPRFHAVEKDHGMYFLAMEWIDGISLENWLRMVGEVPIAAARAITLQLLRTIDYLHRLPLANGRTLSVHHGDISPQNLIIAPEGRLVVIDLGACSSVITPRPPGFEILGTLPYMAPEIINGHAPHVASDLWSIGCVFYEMLTGIRPFDGLDDYETVELISEGAFESPDVDGYGALEEQILRRTLSPRGLGSSEFGHETARDLIDTIVERTDEQHDQDQLLDLLRRSR